MTEMTFAEKRHDELTRAPKSSEEDAAPRITLSKGTNGATRIDVAETAVVRPGNPDMQHPDKSHPDDNPGSLPDPDITTDPDGTPVENPSGAHHG